MTGDEAAECVGRIMGAVGGAGWDDVTVNVWIEKFQNLTGPHTYEAGLAAARRIGDEWTSTFAPPLGHAVEVFRAEQAAQVRMHAPALRPAGAQCDGSGWNHDRDGHMVPCRRCNPALSDIYADPDKLTRWRSGVSAADLGVGVDRGRNGTLHYADGFTPLKCESAWEHEPPSVPIEQGFAIARRAYEATCREQGRKPNEHYFRRAMNAITVVGPEQ